MKCNMLGKRLKSWFTDSHGDCTKDFGFRFRGQESRAYLTHFPALISLLFRDVGEYWQQKLLRVHLQSILPPNAVSYLVRITNVSRQLHKSCCKFDTSFSPTMWSCANVLYLSTVIRLTVAIALDLAAILWRGESRSIR